MQLLPIIAFYDDATKRWRARRSLADAREHRVEMALTLTTRAAARSSAPRRQLPVPHEKLSPGESKA
jgi:hypothetical protein